MFGVIASRNEHLIQLFIFCHCGEIKNVVKYTLEGEIDSTWNHVMINSNVRFERDVGTFKHTINQQGFRCFPRRCSCAHRFTRDPAKNYWSLSPELEECLISRGKLYWHTNIPLKSNPHTNKLTTPADTKFACI